MHKSVLDFGAKHLTAEVVAGKKGVEMGAFDENGSIRPLVEAIGPASYLGIDQCDGPCVDVVMKLPCELPTSDVVITCEMLEHAEDWRGIIRMIRDIVADDGYLMLTTRSKGFVYHGFPDDHWRFSVDDLSACFADWEIIEACADPQYPGVFIFARKPRNPAGVDLEAIEVYSMEDDPKTGPTRRRAMMLQLLSQVRPKTAPPTVPSGT